MRLGLLVSLAAVAGACTLSVCLFVPVLRGRVATVDSRAQVGVVFVLLTGGVALLFLPSRAFDVGAAVAFLAALALAGSRFKGMRWWLVLNARPPGVQGIALRTLSLLGYDHRRLDGRIELLRPAGNAWFRSCGPWSTLVVFTSSSPSPRFELFVTGFRKRLRLTTARADANRITMQQLA